ncbi:hypothetical protein JTE90_003825 [Oedothorax gibbosus]|uniref:Histone-lysine N-methyltransferase SETMAR n=1 Tax=Oedothorax gibbosus TaxID=931172 RepID=A0AAV6VHR6_9ARAC|nr:hypothetical protein JTE90_003825 [Oedothorax gibbosus]
MNFLERYHNVGDDFLSQVVTGDETWVAYVTPESKQQSMEWRHSDSPKQNKRRGKLSKGIVLLHDNARPHVANRTKDLITSFKWETLDHPPYSPDLAPSDYHLFLHLKKHLGGQRLQDDDEVKTVVMQWLTSQAADFYEEGIQKPVQRYDKCLNIGGNYVEK